MSITKMEQFRIIKELEITVAVHNPKGPLDLMDEYLSEILDRIESCLEKKEK